ncbi:hypothetical protein SAMN05421823_102701 [Catalinimonas alkaloidigena]|uniref:Uncharacterized protein n=1 Tax=Catalinimonas alkaloidigena TaxID=1075417 RepID=A0A1G9BSV2_9BACT|nr:hypothetical protein [Catalinimonas alkaloidigena]SDK42517.1 hypothetical protein SAMN05421823_102701 [Catalinimonas alkaloidigena]
MVNLLDDPDYQNSHIVALADQYVQMLEKISLRRSAWQRNKQVLLQILQQIEKEVELDWQVRTNNEYSNMEQVSLSFPLKQLGIHYEDKFTRENKSYFMKGGGLNYSQMANGMIHVWVSMPTVDELREYIGEPPVIGIIDPAQLNSKLIIKHIEKFLKYVLLWDEEGDYGYDLEMLTIPATAGTPPNT